MTSAPGRTLLTVAAALVGLSAGFFVTYQVSVTRGLAQVGDVAYVETFQAINDTVATPWFAAFFFGSLPALVVAAVAVRARTDVLAIVIVALALYVAGVVVTGVGNVPLNDELASVSDLTPTSARDARDQFEADWNRLNLIRTGAILCSFVVTLLAVHVAGRVTAPHRDETPCRAPVTL